MNSFLFLSLNTSTSYAKVSHPSLKASQDSGIAYKYDENEYNEEDEEDEEEYDNEDGYDF